MPAYDRSETHRRRIDAPAAATWTAMKELRDDEMSLMRALMSIRTLGRTPRGGDRTVLSGFRSMGFRPIAEQPERELVVAGIGRFWTLSGGLRKVEGSEQFAAFEEPGYAKVAFDFRLEDGVLSTETRIAGTDEHASRRFGLYWLLIRPGSGLIRREWLRAIEKRAQATRGKP